MQSVVRCTIKYRSAAGCKPGIFKFECRVPQPDCHVVRMNAALGKGRLVWRSTTIYVIICPPSPLVATQLRVVVDCARLRVVVDCARKLR